MVKIHELKVDQLKFMLRERDLPTAGARAELILRLQEHTGSEDIEMPNSTDFQEQIDELREMMQQLVAITTRSEQRSGNAEECVRIVEPNLSGRHAYSVKEIADVLPEFDPTDQRHYKSVYASDRMKPYCVITEYSDTDSGEGSEREDA